jgi:putative ABC transport system permease protein
MSFWRQLSRGLRNLTHRDAADRDAADEVQHYLDETAAGLVAQGMSPADAQLAARRELGSVRAIGEEVRSYGWENLVASVLADVRYGVRRLRATPGFTLIAILTLGIGIGGASSIFSAVNPVLFASLPYPHPDRVVSIREVARTGQRSGGGTFAMYRHFADRAHAFESIAVFRPWRPTLTGADRPERFEGQRVSAAYFRVLGVTPRIGRGFDPADDRPDGDNVVILSDGLWKTRFASDPAVVGRQVKLDDTRYTVIGVLPAGFENVTSQDAKIWTALQYDPALPNPNGREWGHHLKTIARLGPGTDVAEATRETVSLGRGLIAAVHPTTYDAETTFVVVPLGDDLASGVKPALLAILGAVGLLLVIAGVNVTNLLLARGMRRRGEFALRIALGAGRVRLIRQVLTESAVLAAAGGAIGIALAVFAVRGLVALSPPDLPRSDAIAVNTPVLLFALGITVAIAIGFGIIPALQAARSDPHTEMQSGSQRTVGGHRRTRRALVVAEVALALMLLVASGLLMRSLQRLFSVPLGFDPSGLVTMQVQAVGHRYDADDARQRLFDRELDAVRAVPGVISAGFTSQLPLSGDRDQYGASFAATATRRAQVYGVFRYAITPGYLETAQIPLFAGRLFNDRDTATAPHVALISASLAKERFGDESPIGTQVTMGLAATYTIVGIVGNVRQASLELSDPDAVYIPAAQSWFSDNPRSLIAHTRGDAAALAPAIREAIWSVDKDQPISRVAAMQNLVAASAAERRFALMLFEIFGLTALVLAAIGIYGVLSGSVNERIREIGVRIALGATRTEIVSLVVRQAMTLTAAGVVIGLAAALFASRALETLLFGITRRDPATYVGVVAILLGAAALAAWLPAWRAARVDPALTLRAE